MTIVVMLTSCDTAQREKLARLVAADYPEATYDQNTNTVTLVYPDDGVHYDLNNHKDIATQWAVTLLQKNLKRDRKWLDLLTAVRKSGATIEYQITYPNGQRETAVVYPTMLPGAFNTKDDAAYLELRSDMLLLNTTLPRTIKPGITLMRQKMSKTEGLIDELLYPNSEIGDLRQFQEAVRQSHSADLAALSHEVKTNKKARQAVAHLVKLGLPRVYRKSQPNHLVADDVITAAELKQLLATAPE